MIFTFYSYKGGVGRTHLLANMAAYLCHYQNRKVLMIDWDLEAPGLHYYFGENNETVQKLGIVDLMLQFEQQRKQATEENQLKDEDLFFPDENYIHNLVTNENGGKIDLIPATKYEKDFHHKIGSFDWLDFYENKEGYVYLSWLKEQLKKRSRYDYVFIDSRTGFNDYSGICNVLMPDMNIILVAPNDQNFEGAKQMANRIIHSPYTESNARNPFILPILSRLNASSPDADEWRTKFAKTFAFLIDELDDDIKAFKEEVLEQVSALTVLEYTPKFATGEKIHFKEEAIRIVAGSALKNFENIALLFLEKMNKKGKINLNEFVGDKMISVYMRSIKQNPEDYETYWGLGNAYFELENYDEAIVNYQKAIEIKPNQHEVFYNLGLAYSKVEYYEKAIVNYQKAIEIKPNKYGAFYNLGNIYYKLEDYKKAIENYQKAVEIKPDFYKAFNNLGNAYDEVEDYEKAIENYQKAVKIKSDFHEAFNNLGLIYSKLENHKEAIKSYQKTIEIKPNDHTLNGLGLVYANQSDYKRAIQSFYKIIINEDASQVMKENAYFNIACLYSLQKDKNETLKYLKEAVLLNPIEWRINAKKESDIEWLWQDEDFLKLIEEEK